MPEKVILLTGYPPFGNHTVNPSGMAAKALNGREIGGYRIQGEILPCDCKQMPTALADLIERFQPALVVGTGLAFSDSQIRLERVGLNWLNFGSTPDNGGNMMKGQPALENGPAAFISTLPVDQIVGRLRREGVPAYVSGHAGGHLCNHMLYIGSYLASQMGEKAPKVGFVHIPALPSQAAAEAERDNLRMCASSMSLELIVQGIEIVLQESVKSL